MLRTFIFFIFTLLVAFPSTAQEMKQSVVGMVVGEGSLNSSLYAVGTFTAYNDVVLKAEAKGRIECVHFKDGDQVNPNQLLFTIYNAEQKIALKKAETALKLSRNKLKRKKTLVEREFISPEAFEEVELQLEADEAAYLLAKEELEKTNIRAPFDGSLSERNVSRGSFVDEGDSLVRIQDITPIQFLFQIPQRELTHVKVGDRVIATTELYPHEKFEGQIEAIEPNINEETRTLTLYATFPNKEKKLVPGLYGRVSLETSCVKSHAPVIPEQALVIRPEGSFVYKIEKDKAVLAKVNLGTRTSDMVQVLSGLKVGDAIVLEGQDNLHDGSTVSVQMKK